ncbi:MAG: cell division protein ZipA [Proteobacteria bacterium]|nr:cell division protein ZipA [Pseudomonadota bacterium]
MDGLRWLLLLVGLLVVVGVYLYTRYQRGRNEDKSEAESSARRFEPSIRDSENSETELLADSDIDDEESNSVEPVPPQKIVTLRVVARNHGAFPGDDLVLSLRGIGLRHGKFGIFHRFEGSDENKIIFSAASLVEPGSFDLANIKDQVIPGVSLFMVLPGPIDGAQGFDLMMATARALAKSLDAELLDESGSTLSIQRERYLREEIIHFQHSSSLA